jgi:8-oxo-dGTP diphosphatase
VIDVVCAIVLDRKRVLATRRSSSMPHPLQWEFPGGKLKEGESPEAALIREIREELGIEVRPIERLPDILHHYPDQSVRLIPFFCHHMEGVIHLAEHQEFIWVDFRELNDLEWLEADRDVVAMVKEKLS